MDALISLDIICSCLSPTWFIFLRSFSDPASPTTSSKQPGDSSIATSSSADTSQSGKGDEARRGRPSGVRPGVDGSERKGGGGGEGTTAPYRLLCNAITSPRELDHHFLRRVLVDVFSILLYFPTLFKSGAQRIDYHSHVLETNGHYDVLVVLKQHWKTSMSSYMKSADACELTDFGGCTTHVHGREVDGVAYEAASELLCNDALSLSFSILESLYCSVFFPQWLYRRRAGRDGGMDDRGTSSGICCCSMPVGVSLARGIVHVQQLRVALGTECMRMFKMSFKHRVRFTRKNIMSIRLRTDLCGHLRLDLSFAATPSFLRRR